MINTEIVKTVMMEYAKHMYSGLEIFKPQAKLKVTIVEGHN
jgi:hypothetical protein